MDFELTSTDEDLRQEVRAWLAQHYPDGFGRAGRATTDLPDEETWTFARDFAKKLAAKCWLAPGWPVEHGGAGMSSMQQFVFKRELALHDAPSTGSESAIEILGPVFLQHMTHAQKAEHLRPISSGEVSWCQGYSEPEAGSDLASLRTRAVRDGDEYVVNGTKIWTTGAHRRDWILLLVRTDPDAPKWAGISLLMAKLDTPGITIRPIENLLGQTTFNQIFLDDVRLPVDHLIGEENHGWKLVTQSLASERSLIGGMAKGFNHLARLVEHCAGHDHPSGCRLIDLPHIRRQLADLRVSLEVGNLLSSRVASMTAKGRDAAWEGSMVKVFGSELQVAMARDAVSILGPQGLLVTDDPRAPFDGEFCEAYQFSPVMRIGGGANEVQRNIIAQRGLGLPKK
ncbi:MAG: acyl-CoA dehydrogenase family protein [Acidimicrobiales bacterium]